MMRVRSERLVLTFIIALACAFLFNVKGLNAQVKLEETDVTFTELILDYDAGYLMTTSDSVKIKKDAATSSNPKVAVVYSYEDHISIDPRGMGECTVTVPGEDGTSATVHVKVTEEYMKKWLKRSVSEIVCIYGIKKLSFWTDRGVYGTIKIGKDSFSFKANKSDDRQQIVKKLKKLYKYNEKITITAKIDSNKGSGGKTVTVKVKGWVFSPTYLDYASASGKTLKLKIWDLPKGDKVIITYKGKKYTRNIKKNKSMKWVKLTFKLKKKLKKDASFKIVVKNKFKQTVYSDKINLIDGEYQYIDPDEEDTGSEY